ncbi:MAG: alpha/beta hydrolase [Deltaproteobacteria bacterium]|nr:alpha/beta hydrolase [Deltaproteobacteria bacterium]
MPFKKINGINIYYEVHGEDGRKGTIVLLHHGFGCVKIWKTVCPVLAEQGYRIIMYDRRGYGRSEKGYDFMGFYVSDNFRPDSVEEMALLLSSLDTDSVHVIGQCEGGVVGVDFAAKYPDRVHSIVIASTQCCSQTTMVDKNAEDFPKPFHEIDPLLQKKITEWHGEFAEPFYEQFRKFGGAYGTEIFDLRENLASVICPALVLYPDRSSIFDVEQAVEMYRNLPRGELAVLPACGHNTYEYKPADYVRNVLEFLERHGSNGKISAAQEDVVGFSCLAVRKDSRP